MKPTTNPTETETETETAAEHRPTKAFMQDATTAAFADVNRAIDAGDLPPHAVYIVPFMTEETIDAYERIYAHESRGTDVDTLWTTARDAVITRLYHSYRDQYDD